MSNPTRDTTMATPVPTVVCRNPSVSVSGKHNEYIPNNPGQTVRTGLPPRPSAATTLQWQRSLFQVFGYSHHRGRDRPCPAAGKEQWTRRETVGPSLQELNPAFASARREETFSFLRPCLCCGSPAKVQLCVVSMTNT